MIRGADPFTALGHRFMIAVLCFVAPQSLLLAEIERYKSLIRIRIRIYLLSYFSCVRQVANSHSSVYIQIPRNVTQKPGVSGYHCRFKSKHAGIDAGSNWLRYNVY